LWQIADERIAAIVIAGCIRSLLCLLGLAHNANVGAVHLPAAREGPLTGKQLEKAAAILQNVVCGVFIKAGKVQRIVGHGANPATARGKTIDEAILLERSADKRAHAVEFAPVKTFNFGF